MKAMIVGTVAGISAALATTWLGPPRPAARPVREAPVFASGGPQDLAGRFATDPKAHETPAKLARVLPHVTCQEMPLSKFIEELAKSTGAQFYVEWDAMMGDAAVGPDSPVTMMEKHISGAEALRLALKRLKRGPGIDVRFRAIDGIVKVSTRLDRWPVVRVYDVRDLIEASAELSRRLGVTPDSPQTNPNSVATSDPEQDAVRALRNLILNSIEDPQWPATDADKSVNYYAGRLVVNQTAGNHETIAALLAGLRAKAK
jgi:hypothetical protein